jgi:hypothetical protein
MRRKAIIAFLCLGFIFICAGFVRKQMAQAGHTSFVVTDVSKPFSASVPKSIWPKLDGALFVIVEGHLDGDAAIDITPNHGRDKREIILHGAQIAIVEGSAEEWVDDLQIQYHPGTAKNGELYFGLYCGASFSKEDWARYLRIESQKRK